MRKLSIICFWAFIVFNLLGFLAGITSTILYFVANNIARGFSDLLWTCIVGVVLATTIGIMANEKRCGEDNDR